MVQDETKSKRITPLKEMREAAGLSQEEFAREMGVALSTVRRWESGKIEPALTREKWVKFCSVLKTDFGILPLKLSKR